MFNAAALLELTQAAALKVYEAKRPCDFLVGRILSTAPLRIQAGNLEIPPEKIFVCHTAAEKLSENAPVALLRAEGGQRILVLDILAERREEN